MPRLELEDFASGDFTPVLAKHTNAFTLVGTLLVGVDRIQRKLEPMQRLVERWRQTQSTDVQAKLLFCTLGIPVAVSRTSVQQSSQQWHGSTRAKLLKACRGEVAEWLKAAVC
ncbi:MAG TPA: hypothetical protein VF493_19375 [Terriglobales bacterium]